jgi:plasmid stabilization system protein ParE
VDDVRFHPEALAEYQFAFAWYQARSPQAATRFEAEVERTLGLITVDPGLFPRYDEEHRFVMLERFPFSVVYRAQPGQIQVVALAHSRRSSGYWQGRS